MKLCQRCGNEFKPSHPTRQFCSRKCYFATRSQESLDAFWDRVTKGPGCWEWQGDRHDRGYGRITIRRQKHYAHRVAWEMTNRSIPSGMLVMHTCDNPPCVNPAHLVLGMPEDNSFDMKSKGRAWGNPMHGSQIPSAKLNEAKVAEIRRRRTAGEKPGKLAREFGVSYSTIRELVARRKWTKVA